jgi:hypothetical protein
MIRSADIFLLIVLNVSVLFKFMVKSRLSNLFCVSFSIVNWIIGCMQLMFAKVFSKLVVLSTYVKNRLCYFVEYIVDAAMFEVLDKYIR